MSDPNTSSIFTVWSTMTRLLREATFPPTSKTDDRVAVWFGDYDLPPDEADGAPLALSAERVVVAPFAASPEEGWGPNGRFAREEQFQAFVYVVTAIPGQTFEQVALRLEELTAPIEQVVRTLNVNVTNPVEFARFPSWALEVSRVLPLVAPGPQGAVGTAEIGLRCKFRVGTPPVE